MDDHLQYTVHGLQLVFSLLYPRNFRTMDLQTPYDMCTSLHRKMVLATFIFLYMAGCKGTGEGGSDNIHYLMKSYSLILIVNVI